MFLCRSKKNVNPFWSRSILAAVMSIDLEKHLFYHKTRLLEVSGYTFWGSHPYHRLFYLPSQRVKGMRPLLKAFTASGSNIFFHFNSFTATGHNNRLLQTA